jgi:hypothetical protein
VSAALLAFRLLAPTVDRRLPEPLQFLVDVGAHEEADGYVGRCSLISPSNSASGWPWPCCRLVLRAPEVVVDAKRTDLGHMKHQYIRRAPGARSRSFGSETSHLCRRPVATLVYCASALPGGCRR